MFNINNFNVLSDDEFFYVFRSLEAGDVADLNSGVTDVMRTDRERYKGIAKYSEDSTVSLEEMFDHIKMHYRHDTNCISFTTNAGVAILYGRDNDSFNHDEFNDRYVILRIPKTEMGIKSYFAPEYFIEEISKVLSDYYEKASDLEKYYFNVIDNCVNMEQLKRILSINDDSINEMFQGGIEFKSINSLDYSSLNSEQNFEKNKIIAKINLLPFNIIPNVDNSILIRTLGSAFASTEITHYGSIPSSELIDCPFGFIDLFSILQQSNHPKVKEVENFLIRKLQNHELGNLEKFEYYDYTLAPDDLSIDNLYKATSGKVDFHIIRDLYMKTVFLSKSKLRAYHSIKMLESILGDGYSDLLSDLKNTYGIDYKVINKLSIDKIKLCDSIGLDFSNKLETRLLDIILSEYFSDTNLRSILNDKQLCFQILMEDLFPDNKPIDKNVYYANAIIDSFDWSKYNIKSIDISQRQQLVDKLIENDCVQMYYKLKDDGISEKDISSVLLTTIIRNKLVDVDNVDINNTFDLEELEYFIGYYKLKEANIKLASYQATAVSNIDDLFKSNKYSSAILPLGDDKICIAIAEILRIAQNNDSKILYLVPNDLMIYQIENYIFNYVIGTANTFGKSLLERQKLIKEKFPNLVFAKYSSIAGMEKDKYLNEKYDYIIMDELHRTGADNVLKNLKVLFGNQGKNVKVLGLATTAMRDHDSIDMADYWASYFGYSDEEVSIHKHLALNLNVYEAISLGYVVNPKKVVCEYELLRDNGEFDNISEKIALIEDEQSRNAALSEYERCRREASSADGIKEVLNSNLQKGKRYIVYCPIVNNNDDNVDENDNNSRITGADIIKQYTELLEQYLGKENIECFNMQGSSSVSISNLARFENSDSNKISFMLVFDKLNESVKVKNDGIIWFRSIDRNSSILCTKQLENALYPLYPGQIVKDDDRPIVIDLTNNLYRVKKNGDIKHNRDYVTSLNTIISWMNHTGEVIIPDMNSSSSIESGYAKTLRRVQKLYSGYVNDLEKISMLSPLEQRKTKEVIRLGNSIDLWDMEFPEVTSKSSKNKSRDSEDLLAITGVLSDFDRLSESVDEAYKNNWISFDFNGKIEKIFNAIKNKDGEFIERESYMYKWLVNPKNRSALINKAQNGDIKCIYIGLRMGRKASTWVSFDEAIKFYPVDKMIDGLNLFEFDPTDISYQFKKLKNMDDRIDLAFECLKKNIKNIDIELWLENGQIKSRIKKKALESNHKAMYISIHKGFISVPEAFKIEEYSRPDMLVDGERLYPETPYIYSFEKNIDNVFGSKYSYDEERKWIRDNEEKIISAAKNGNAKAMYICIEKDFISVPDALAMKEYSNPDMLVDGIRLYSEDLFYFKSNDEKIDEVFSYLKDRYYFPSEYSSWLLENKQIIMNSALKGNAKAMYICIEKDFISIPEALKIKEYSNPDMLVDGERLYPEIPDIYPFEKNIDDMFEEKYFSYVRNDWIRDNKEKIISAAKNGNVKAMYISIHEGFISVPEAFKIKEYSNPDMLVDGKRLYPVIPYIYSFEKNIDNVFRSKYSYDEKDKWMRKNRQKIISAAKNGNAKAMYISMHDKCFISVSDALAMKEYSNLDMLVDGKRLYSESLVKLLSKPFTEAIDDVFYDWRTLGGTFDFKHDYVEIKKNDIIASAKNGNAKAMFLCLKYKFIPILDAIDMEAYSDPDMLVDGVSLYPPSIEKILFYNTISVEQVKELFSKITYHDRLIICDERIMSTINKLKNEIVEFAKLGNKEAMYICLRKYDESGKQWITNDEAFRMNYYKDKNMMIGDYKLYPKTDIEIFVENFFDKIKDTGGTFRDKENSSEALLSLANGGNLKALYICLRVRDLEGNPLIDENDLINSYSDDTTVDGSYLYPSVELKHLKGATK